MNAIVIYKTKYGATQKYAEWIAEELNCEIKNVKDVKIDEISTYDTIIYGGGLYAEVIDGVVFITRNLDKLENKNIVVFSTGITPLKYREYYDKLVVEKNFKSEMLNKIKIFNFMGKMKMDELSLVHKSALKTLKQIMIAKKEPTEMEKLLVELCDADGDFTDRESIKELIEYIRSKELEV